MLKVGDILLLPTSPHTCTVLLQPKKCLKVDAWLHLHITTSWQMAGLIVSPAAVRSPSRNVPRRPLAEPAIASVPRELSPACPNLTPPTQSLTDSWPQAAVSPYRKHEPAAGGLIVSQRAHTGPDKTCQHDTICLWVQCRASFQNQITPL